MKESCLFHNSDVRDFCAFIRFFIATIFLASFSTTGAQAATIGSWSFSLDGDIAVGSVSFSGADINNDKKVKSSDNEITQLLVSFSNGAFGSPGFVGIFFNLEFAELSYNLDGTFGNGNGDFLSFNRDQTFLCSLFVCGPGPDGSEIEVTSSSSFHFSGSFVSFSRETTSMDYGDISRFSLSQFIGPQVVDGPRKVAPVQLPASGLLMFTSFICLMLFHGKRARDSLNPSLEPSQS